MRHRNYANNGFTLIELSIVLVIIGLIVGGVLVGRDLITGARIRSQISQIERYNTSANTFRGKFGALPGDIDVAAAGSYGFDTTSCDGTEGLRNGNGLLDNTFYNYWQGGDEQGLFWKDLSSTMAGNLIDGSFTLATCTLRPDVTDSGLAQYMPPAKIKTDAYVYVYLDSSFSSGTTTNQFGISTNRSIAAGRLVSSGPAFTVAEAYKIDAKLDDGLAPLGRVRAMGLTSTHVVNSQSSDPDSEYTCYNSTTNQYSLSINTGTNFTCMLSFTFQ